LLHDSTADAIVEHALFLALIVGAVVVAADAAGKNKIDPDPAPDPSGGESADASQPEERHEAPA